MGDGSCWCLQRHINRITMAANMRATLENRDLYIWIIS